MVESFVFPKIQKVLRVSSRYYEHAKISVNPAVTAARICYILKTNSIPPMKLKTGTLTCFDLL